MGVAFRVCQSILTFGSRSRFQSSNLENSRTCCWTCPVPTNHDPHVEGPKSSLASMYYHYWLAFPPHPSLSRAAVTSKLSAKEFYLYYYARFMTMVFGYHKYICAYVQVRHSTYYIWYGVQSTVICNVIVTYVSVAARSCGPEVTDFPD